MTQTNKEMREEFMTKCEESFAKGGFLTTDLGDKFRLDTGLVYIWFLERTISKTALLEWLEGRKVEDFTNKDIEDKLRVFTLTPFSEESIKEYTKTIGGIVAKIQINKTLSDFCQAITSGKI